MGVASVLLEISMNGSLGAHTLLGSAQRDSRVVSHILSAFIYMLVALPSVHVILITSRLQYCRPKTTKVFFLPVIYCEKYLGYAHFSGARRAFCVNEFL
jgi:hypothetical protein